MRPPGGEKAKQARLLYWGLSSTARMAATPAPRLWPTTTRRLPSCTQAKNKTKQSYVLYLAHMFTGQSRALSRAHVYRPKSKLHLACMFSGQTNVTSCAHVYWPKKSFILRTRSQVSPELNQSYIVHACLQARPKLYLAPCTHVYRPQQSYILKMFTGQNQSYILHTCLQAKIKVTPCMYVSRSNQSYMIYKCAGQIKVTLSTDVHKSIQTYIFHACAQVSSKLNLFNTWACQTKCMWVYNIYAWLCSLKQQDPPLHACAQVSPELNLFNTCACQTKCMWVYIYHDCIH